MVPREFTGFIKYFPFFLFSFNLLLKLIYIDAPDIAHDEPFSIFHAQMPIAEIITELNKGNNPPLYEIILHIWIKAFGIEPFSVRFLSALFTSINSIVIFMIGKRFFSLRTGIIASLIFTFSSYHTGFAHEARVYALLALLANLSMYCYFALHQKPKSNRYLFLLLVCNVLLIYAHYLSFFIFLVQLAGVYFSPDKKQLLKKVSLAFFILFLAFLPNLTIFYQRLVLTSNEGTTWLGNPGVEALYDNIRKFSNMPVVAVAFISLLVMGIFKSIRTSNRKSVQEKIILLWFFLPFFLMFMISYKLPVFLDRYLIFTSTPFYLLVAVYTGKVITDLLWNNIMGATAVAAMAITMNLNPNQGRKFKIYVDVVKRHKLSGTIVFLSPPWLNLGFLYYYNREKLKDYKNISAYLQKENIFCGEYGDVINDNSGKKRRVIYLQQGSEYTDPENKFYEELEQEFVQTKTLIERGNTKVTLFAR